MVLEFDHEIDVFNQHCPSRQVLDLVADKWSVLVIYALADNTLRYSALRRAIDGISKKMLTQTLRTLERSGLVHREVYAVVPPKVEYTLTTLGQSLYATMHVLCRWAQDNIEDVVVAPADYDKRQEG